MQSNAEIGEIISEGRHNKTGPGRVFTKAATPCFRTFIASFYFCFILELLALKMNGAMAVPDPEPRLLDANAATPGKLQLLFRPSGKYAVSTHFIHILQNYSKLQLKSSIHTTPTSINGRNHSEHKSTKLRTSANHAWRTNSTTSTTSWPPYRNMKSSPETNDFWI
jgi:hypothetical protein